MLSFTQSGEAAPSSPPQRQLFQSEAEQKMKTDLRPRTSERPATQSTTLQPARTSAPDAPETAPIRTYSKKMVATLNRELTKIHRNLEGIREMNRLPDALVVVDPKREHIGVKEAQRVGIATVALIDTDSDPDTVDLAIPGNDDSIRSIELILAKLSDAVLEGKASLPPPEAQGRGPRGGGPNPRTPAPVVS